ncbi:MAG TPA: CPBP family intramembrane glutamic endopeptidase [Candidatus Dormibacteraeota bacterium]|nr:CPBP family intramembrane glutamic endopeptidase [Candidatus Dormibacteraeota bacterium]
MILAPSRGAVSRLASLLVAICLCAGVAAAMALRLALAPATRGSSPAAVVVFSGALLLLAVVAGWRPSRPTWQGAIVGLAGAAVLCALPVWSRISGHNLGGWGPWSMFAGFAGGVVLVSVAEEVLLRGALYDAVAAARGEPAAVLVAAIAFGLLHVPLYGWAALPLDLAVGVWLGGLRMLSGGVTAPAAAHAAADVAAWWLW